MDSHGQRALLLLLVNLQLLIIHVIKPLSLSLSFLVFFLVSFATSQLSFSELLLNLPVACNNIHYSLSLIAVLLWLLRTSRPSITFLQTRTNSLILYHYSSVFPYFFSLFLQTAHTLSNCKQSIVIICNGYYGAAFWRERSGKWCFKPLRFLSLFQVRIFLHADRLCTDSRSVPRLMWDSVIFSLRSSRTLR